MVPTSHIIFQLYIFGFLLFVSILSISNRNIHHCQKSGKTKLQEELLFFQNPDGPDANLVLTPTNACASVIPEGEDYGSKVSINDRPQRVCRTRSV
jgi:hypothetical protein